MVTSQSKKYANYGEATYEYMTDISVFRYDLYTLVHVLPCGTLSDRSNIYDKISINKRIKNSHYMPDFHAPYLSKLLFGD